MQEELPPLGHVSSDDPTQDPQFQLITPYHLKGVVLVLLGIAVMAAVGWAGFEGLDAYGQGPVLGWGLLVVVGGIYGLVRLVKTQAINPLTVTVRPDALHLHWPRTGLEKTVAFQQITSYKMEEYNGNEQLRLRLNDTTKVLIATNPSLYGGQPLTGLVQCFEQRLRAAPVAAGTLAPQREKSFLETTAATVVLVVLGVLVLGLTVAVFVVNRPVRGGLFMVYGGYITFAVSWYRARQPPQ